jgi:AraC-like DNA-binding protein
MSQDILSDVLRNVRLRGALYYFVSGSGTWAAEAPASREIAGAVMPGAEHVMEYHVVTRGRCFGAIVGDAPVSLGPGDVVLFAHGDAHVVSSAPGLRAPVDPRGDVAPRPGQLPFALHLAESTTPGAAATDRGDGRETTLVCGFLGCDLRPFNPLIATLPRLLHVAANDDRGWIASFLRHVVRESQDKRPGGEAMLERLSEMMFIDAVRRHVDALPDDSRGWLAGLRDRFVGRALALVHDAPSFAWTVEELGRRTGLSRSALHERFLGIIGQPPMQYLASWRMQVAATLLRNPRTTVTSVAHEVGYESEAAFARAFKRLVGQSPGAWRRQATSAPPAVPRVGAQVV